MRPCLRRGSKIGLKRVNGFDGLQTVNDSMAKHYGNSPVCLLLKAKRPKPTNSGKSGEKA
jgi:hypothetical protein